MNKILLSFLIVLITIIFPIVDGIADWKFHGGTTIKGVEMILFYDAESLKQLPGKVVQVWVKGIKEYDFDMAFETNEKQIIEKSAKEIVNKYYPPYFLLNPKASYDDMISIISWEVMVNSFEVKKSSMFLFEINCIDKKIRTLSGTIFKNKGEIVSGKGSGEWNFIPPESNSETLQKILCK